MSLQSPTVRAYFNGEWIGERHKINPHQTRLFRRLMKKRDCYVGWRGPAMNVITSRTKDACPKSSIL